jgi:hypothetical protein
MRVAVGEAVAQQQELGLRALTGRSKASRCVLKRMLAINPEDAPKAREDVAKAAKVGDDGKKRRAKVFVLLWGLGLQRTLVRTAQNDSGASGSASRRMGGVLPDAATAPAASSQPTSWTGEWARPPAQLTACQGSLTRPGAGDGRMRA